jgi:hypothetical protein
VWNLLDRVDDRTLAALQSGLAAQDARNWRMTQDDCVDLVDLLAGHHDAAASGAAREAELAG